MDVPAVDRVRDRCRAHPRVLPGASGSAQELSKPVQGLLGRGGGGHRSNPESLGAHEARPQASESCCLHRPLIRQPGLQLGFWGAHAPYGNCLWSTRILSPDVAWSL